MKKYILLLFITLVLTACDDLPSDLSFPIWDVDLNLPLTERNYTLDQLVKRDRFISADTNGLGNWLYIVTSDEYYEGFSVEDVNKNLLDGDFGYDVPLITVDTLVKLQLSSGAEIDSAIFKSGILEVSAENTSSGSVDFEFILPAMHKNGQNLKISGSVAAGQKITLDENLVNYIYTTKDQQSEKSMLYVDSKLTATPSADLLKFKFTIKQSNFRYMKGKINPFNLDPIRKGAKLPIDGDVLKFRDKIKLKNAEMYLSATYQSSYTPIFDTEFQNLRLIGKRNNGETFNLNDENGQLYSKTLQITNGKLNLTFNNSNSNISEFLSFMPDSILIVSDILLNPNSKTGIATDVDSVKIEIQIKADSQSEIIDLVLDENTEFSMDTDARDNLKSLKEAILFYELENYLPLNSVISMEYLNENNVNLFTKNVSIAGATVESGSVMPKFVNQEFVLDSTECKHLANCYNLNISVLANSTGSDGNNAYFGPKQQLKLKSKLRLKSTVK